MPGTREHRQVQGRPRRNVVDDDHVGVYHVWSRCVRRAWLCGQDPLTGKDWRHRKAWFFERLQELTAIFAIDACVWAILSNHYHLIIRNRPDLAAQWSDVEVVRRWWRLCPERKDEQGRPAEPTELEINSLLADPAQVAEYRKRLSSVSWFMKSLNEWFSRRANARRVFTDTFGRNASSAATSSTWEPFWPAASTWTSMKFALTWRPRRRTPPNTSAYRRILARILRRARAEASGAAPAPAVTDYQSDDPDYWLCPVDEQDRAPLLGPVVAPSCGAEAQESAPLQGKNTCPAVKPWRHGFLPVSVDEYLKLLDWTGRQVVAGKRGVIDEACPPILERLGLQPSLWLETIEQFGTCFHGAVGHVEAMVAKAAQTGRHWIQGLNRCRDAFT